MAGVPFKYIMKSKILFHQLVGTISVSMNKLIHLHNVFICFLLLRFGDLIYHYCCTSIF